MPATVRLDRAFFLQAADWLVVAVAIALPWSTSVSLICGVVWVFVLLPTLDAATIKRELVTAAGGLPVLLWFLGAAGMLWADVGWTERFHGLDSFHRLLVIPALLAQFRRSGRGGWVVCGFLASSAVLLLLSYALVLFPALPWRSKTIGVPAHNYIFQNTEFLVCAFGALGVACDQARKRHWPAVLALVVVALLFLGNIAFVFASRAALFVLPVLALLLGWRQLRWRGLVAGCVLIGAIGAAAWFTSPSLRARIDNSIKETRNYIATNEASSTGLHAAFLRESLTIIAAAPVIGHGTGSIAEQFRHATAGATGAAAVVSDNPHNQTFAVAIQLGLLGTVALWAMWIAHFQLFRGGGSAAWIGAVIVAENILSSLVHSHLFDFTHGWLYVYGVGVLGGMVLREQAQPSANGAAVRN
ncbi:MAG TPA: O-antigen ligase family protein [Xanthobacteraceae bacterium]|nr:O-antigen ligase family protein [Xanthobacteraceae bacterium]